VRFGDGLQARGPAFDPQNLKEICLYLAISRPALGPIKSPIIWEPGGGMSSGLRRQEHEADYSPVSSVCDIPPFTHSGKLTFK
jgi:hypothetical protein